MPPQLEDIVTQLDRVDNSLLECINLAQTTLGENSILIAENPRITRPFCSSGSSGQLSAIMYQYSREHFEHQEA